MGIQTSRYPNKLQTKMTQITEGAANALYYYSRIPGAL